MVKIKEAILVEGRYDKNTLSQILDAPILETSGFGIMKDKAQLELLRSLFAAGCKQQAEQQTYGQYFRFHKNSFLRKILSS